MKKVLYFIILFVSIFVLSNSINAWSKYEVGDKVTYKGIDFYVIDESSEEEDGVTMLKADALKYNEVSDYLNNTEISRKIREENGYIKIAYYTRDNCVTAGDNSGCITDYLLSDMKQVVDVWANNYLNMRDLVIDKEGYKVRLITYLELTDNLGYAKYAAGGTIPPSSNGYTPDWVHSQNYSYCTITQYSDNNDSIWSVSKYLSVVTVNNEYSAVRPVITIKKSALGDINEQEDINKDDKNTVLDNNSSEDINVITKTEDSKVSVNVPNTMQKVSIILIMVGVLLLSISIFLVIKNKRVIKNK